jgi:hypothetical protein
MTCYFAALHSISCGTPLPFHQLEAGSATWGKAEARDPGPKGS